MIKGNERKIVSTVIRSGSYTGVGLLAAAFVLELMGTVVHIDAGVLKELSLTGIVILIVTPITAMVSLSVYFASTRQWKWAAAAAFAGVLMAATFFVIRA